VHVSLLSSAFTWPVGGADSHDAAGSSGGGGGDSGASSSSGSGNGNGGGGSAFQQLQGRCSSALGIESSQLEVYELRKLDIASFSPDEHQHLAVAIKGSRECLQHRAKVVLCWPLPAWLACSSS
jgi:hypothetical protein